MDDSAPSLETVYEGVHTLYNDPVPASKEKAGKWLEALQESVYSWSIADKLLQQKRDFHSCCFAALTMRNKIQTSFHELPPASHESLRDSLLVHISQITPQTEQIIVTQLCLALSDLALLMSSWQNPVLSLIERFSQSPDSLWPLLEILTLIPEEINSRYLRLGANRREEIHQQFESDAATVMDFLNACLRTISATPATGTAAGTTDKMTNPLASGGNANNHSGSGHQTNDQGDIINCTANSGDEFRLSNGASAREQLMYNERIQSRVLKCFTSWIVIHAIQVTDISENPCTNLALSIMCQERTHDPLKLHDIAADCLCALLQMIETQNNNQSQLLEMQLFSGVMNLEKPFHAAVAYENIDAIMNYCRVFTVLSESFLYRMLAIDGQQQQQQQPHYSVKSLELVLKCVAYYDYEVARITFNLWYRLSEELYNLNNDVLTDHFKPYIEHLIGELLRHSQIDSDHDGLIEESEDLFDFRRKVSELIKDVAFIVGSINCFRQMFVTLQDGHVTWEGSEAALFIMSNVAKNVLPEESEVVPKVVEAILNLPENTHIAVRYTSVNLLGELCDWINQHPESLQAVLNFLLYALQQKNGIASAAAGALLSICSACKTHMTCHVQGLIQIVSSLDSFDITNDSAIGLLKGVSIIVMRLSKDELTRAVREMCSIQIRPLLQLLGEQPVDGVNGGRIEVRSRKDPAFWLDRLAAILRHTNPTVRDNEIHPLLPVLDEIWPVISSTFQRYQADLRIMERACRCVRYTIRSVGKQATPILEPLVKQMIHMYSHYPHPCFLYLGSILVDEFAKNSTCTQGLMGMLQAFIEPTFKLLQEGDGLRQHPDTVDDFFRLCSRYLQRIPVEFLQAPVITSIMQCALLACTLDHRDANVSVMKFFGNLLHCGRIETSELMRELVRGLVAAHGDALMVNLLHASIFCLQSYLLSDVADVMIELKMLDTVKFLQALKVALEALPQKNAGGSMAVTQHQLGQFHEAVTISETPKQMTHALRDFARLYR